MATSDQGIRPVCRLKGHLSAVLCCSVLDENTLVSGTEDGVVGLHDLRTRGLVRTTSLAPAEGPVAVPSVLPHAEDAHSLYACAGSCVHLVDICQGSAAQRYAYNSDEVNGIALAPNGHFLAAADDAGEVRVVDVRSNLLYKTLRGGHSNIASGVAFRPHHPWELLSASLDASLIRWSFATGRQLRRWDMAAAAAEDAAAASSQAFNPPLLHAIATATWPGAPRQLGRVVAAARGDGVVALYDADALQPPLPPSQKRPPKGKRAGVRRESCGNGGADPAGRTAEQPDGCIASLGQLQGGHRASVGAVAFHQGSGGRFMLSGGNDAQVIVWDWAAGLPGDSPWRMSADSHSEASGAVKVIRHGRKVHSIASRPDGALNTFVADTSCSIKVYNLL